MNEPGEPPHPSLGIIGALGWGLLTAIATGPFSILLLIAVMIASDPTEVAGNPSEMMVSFLTLLSAGSVLATMFSVLIGWLPISLVGWAIASAGTRWPALQGRAAWATMGMVMGGLCLALLSGTVGDVLKGQDPAGWERLRDMVIFGGGCGIFSALLFRRLTTQTAQKIAISDALVTENLP